MPMTPAQTLFQDGFFDRADFPPADHAGAPAALPDAALRFLLAAAAETGARTVFEFGSGHSTAAFLGAGLRVTSLEDSERWMSQTVGDLAPAHRASGQHVALVRPLRVRWRNGAPVRDWVLTGRLAGALDAADLVLIDSPFHVPFRLSTLLSVLGRPTAALVVLDDTRIPTLARFCDRLARQNPTRLCHRRVPVGHGFDCFTRRDLDTSRPLDMTQPVTETLKAWRRFFMRPRPM